MPTAREQKERLDADIQRLYRQGLSMNEIAERLGIEKLERAKTEE